ncbi:MAG: leucyl aminopeptidase [Actinobacteria bacterium]|nr:MAG: leucyl aminopeptidase [Actinomycetota bacterium]
MAIEVTVSAQVPDDVQVLGVPVFAGRRQPDKAAVELDLAYLAERGFEGKVGEACAVPADDGSTVVAIGMGKPDEVSAETFRRAGAAFAKAAWNDTRAALAVLDVAGDLDRGIAAQALAEGAVLGAYRFTKYKNEAKPSKLESLVLVGRGAKVQTGADRGARIADAVALARNLVNEPAGAMTPSRLADVATEIAEREGLAVTVLDEVAIANEGLGGLQGVAQGSAQPPRLIELVYDPPGARGTIALVGKGITFDSGGLSLKTADGMETMKTDMSGAAAVLATMSVLPALAPKVKVIGILPTTENMPSGTAIKPGDVLKIRNGKTVEVLNTDAEGRLVLADGLSLAVEAGVDVIVDLATLTGACMIALGRTIAGLMGNNDAWVEQVGDAAERAGEKVWPLPLPADYRKKIDSEVADIKNTGGDRYGGALTAGLFLKEFVADVPWAHLDIAGPARSEEDDAYTPKGASGFGVRTLVELVTRYRRPSAARARA